MNNSVVSVIIPVYNVGSFLTQCIGSVTAQTYSNLEIILIDDGSTDDSPAICDEFAKTDERIRVIHQENRGVSAARNVGLNNVNGDYIFFLDSDDYLHESAIELLLNNIIENQSDMGICNFELINESGDQLFRNPIDFSGKPLDENMLWKLMKEHSEITVVWTKIYRREMWSDVSFPEGKIHEDEAVLHKIINKCKKVTGINDKCIIHRENSSSIMGLGFRYKNIVLSEILEDRIQYFLNCNNREMVVYTFGTGSRVLLKALNELTDCNITKDKYFKKLKNDYKRYALKIIKIAPDIKNIIRMLAFCLNLRLYGYLRKRINKHEDTMLNSMLEVQL